jgi:ubiquinone/menaquinone biosynthesis C-methylase UbiE
VFVNLITLFGRLHPGLRAFFFKYWYQILPIISRRADWKFMNYGYEVLSDQEQIPHLVPEDERNRLFIQLYHHVANSIDLRGAKVLEVGCGRGGGADYVMRYLQPESLIGLDLSENVIKLCRKTYALEGLSFETGNAESLPYPANKFDVVINVESSHCYGSVERFFAEVWRILRFGGHFLLADFRRSKVLHQLNRGLEKTGFQIIQEIDITPNILQALESGQRDRNAFVSEAIPGPLSRLAHQFAGTPGSKIFERFSSRETRYLSFVLKKL